MKIVFFNLNRLSYEGGAENYIDEVGTALMNRGHDVLYIGDFRSLLKLFPYIGCILGTTSINGAFHAIKHLDSVESMRTDNTKIRNKVLYLKSFLPFTREKNEILSELESCDVIFVKNEMIDMVFFFLLSRKYFLKSKLIVFTTLYYSIQDDFRSKIHNYLYTGFIYKWLLRKFSGIIVSNTFELEMIPEKYNYTRTRMHYIPYGVQLNQFKPLNVKRDNEKFNILFAGRMETQKGINLIESLILNLSKREEFQNICINLAGGGPGKDIAIRISEVYPNVNYLGIVRKEEMPALYNSHDVVIILSIWETFCYVCLEAQCCGIPVIAFDIPGPNEIVCDQESGFLIPLKDLEKFEEEIMNLYNCKKSNPSLFKKIKDSAIINTRDNFSIEKVVSRLESISYQ